MKVTNKWEISGNFGKPQATGKLLIQEP